VTAGNKIGRALGSPTGAALGLVVPMVVFVSALSWMAYHPDSQVTEAFAFHNRIDQERIPRMTEFLHRNIRTLWIITLILAALVFCVFQVTERWFRQRLLSAQTSPIDTMRNSLEAIQRVVSEGLRDVERARSAIDKALEEEKRVLEQLDQEIKRRRGEAEHYVALASVSKEQQQALVRALGWERRWSIVVSFIVGMATSILGGLALLAMTKTAP